MNNFVSFIARYHNTKTQEKWKPVIFPHAVKNDIYNCGVYIIQFAECIANGKSAVTNCQDPDDYRKTLLTYLLKVPEDVSEICIYCGRKELNTTAKWVQYDTCER